MDGDSPFPGGVRTTFGDADAFAQLLDDTWFYAGHGNDVTLGGDRPTSTSGSNGAGERQTG